jgi:hypothetical protein
VQTISSDPRSAGLEPAAPPSALGLEDRKRDAEGDQAQKQLWQQKKTAAEEELRNLEERRTRLARVVACCNRGSEIVTQDSTGLKYQVSCDEIREQYEANDEQAAELRAYLATGLRRECREAGCLPGWIR